MGMYFCTSAKIPQFSPTHPSGHYKPEAESYKKVLICKGSFSVETPTFRQKSGFRTKKNFSAEKLPFNHPYVLIEFGPYDTLHFHIYKVSTDLYELHGDQDSYDLLTVRYGLIRLSF